MSQDIQQIILDEVRANRAATDSLRHDVMNEFSHVHTKINRNAEAVAMLKERTKTRTKLTAAIGSGIIAISAALWVLLK